MPARLLRPCKPTALLFLLLALLVSVPKPSQADVDPKTGVFTYSGGGGIDQTLAQIALYLMNRHRMEGNVYTSREIETGIVGYQLRFFDNGNQVVDPGDWISVRRYRIPAHPDTTQPAGYYKNTYLELVDVGLDGIDQNDYYFINGRRFDLKSQPESVLKEYQVQIESGITAYIQRVGYQTILQAVGASQQVAAKKNRTHQDGSLSSKDVLGLDLRYVFRPIMQNNKPLPKKQMIQEIRNRIGFVYSATVEYTDVDGYRFREIADQTTLLQRTYDISEAPILSLVLDALFDRNGDGVITPQDLENGYTRFREIHQQLSDNARNESRRIVLPNEKLARLRKEYEAIHNKPYKIEVPPSQ